MDCGHFDPGGFKAAEPRLVAEVLSPSTRDFDAFQKLEKYKAVPSIAHILLVEPNEAEVAMWSRAADGSWQASRVRGMEESLSLPALEVTLFLAEIYDGIEFPEIRPRLVLGGRP